MSIFKFQNYSAIKNAQDNPRVRATQVTKNGYAFKISDNYSTGGSKSKVDVTFAVGTIADGNITFDIGGQRVYTAIVAATQTTVNLVAAEVKDSLDAVLLGLGYTVAIADNVITITAPANGASLSTVTIENYNGSTTTATITTEYTAGSNATSYQEAAVPFASDTEAKTAQVYIAMNVQDKPEVLNTDEYQIEVGEPVRSINLNKLIGEMVELSGDLVTTSYSTVAKNDILVPVPSGTNNMKWKKTTDTGYGVALKVINKTPFGSFTIDAGNGTVVGGFECKIVSN
jgi:hypothetical protein